MKRCGSNLSQLDFDQETLDRQEQLWKEGATTEAAVRAAWRQVQADKILAERAKSTLRSWRLTEKEISDIETEAIDFIKRNKDPRSRVVSKGNNPESWARVEVRVPQSNDRQGRSRASSSRRAINLDTMVDPSVDLFELPSAA